MVAYLRANAMASIYDASMTVPMAQQVISVLELLSGKDGTTEGVERYVHLPTAITWSCVFLT